jgi:hypothetical protein
VIRNPVTQRATGNTRRFMEFNEVNERSEESKSTIE